MMTVETLQMTVIIKIMTDLYPKEQNELKGNVNTVRQDYFCVKRHIEVLHKFMSNYWHIFNYFDNNSQIASILASKINSLLKIKWIIIIKSCMYSNKCQ